MKDSPRDELFADPLAKVPEFKFDDSVARVFPDMIKRSVPGYATILHMISQITARYAQANTACYDLGCSLGASLLAMREGIQADNVALFGVDNSAEMISRCRSVLATNEAEPTTSLLCDDVMNIEFAPMSVCVMNFTLQFIPLNQRKDILQRIANAMVPSGVLVVSEKLAFDDPQHHNLMNELHHDFKRSNGYSQLEIAQKRDAIENVLIPEAFDTHKRRLLDAGFRSVDLWFQCFNFSSFIAFK